jgi:hypothetical protein
MPRVSRTASPAPTAPVPPGLLALANPRTLQSPEDLLRRLSRLESALAGDGRVTFASAYRVITRAGLDALAAGKLQDVPTSRALMTAFGRRYLVALEASLKGEEIPRAWRSHMEVAAGKPPSLRALTAAMDAHLTVDLAEALAEVRAPASYRADFLRFGEALADATPRLVGALRRHGVEAEAFLGGGPVGDVLDGFAGEGATSRLGFQVVRTEAWTSGQALGNPAFRPLIRQGLSLALAHREWLLDRVAR